MNEAAKKMKASGFRWWQFRITRWTSPQPRFCTDSPSDPPSMGTAVIDVRPLLRGGKRIPPSQIIAERTDAILAAGLCVEKTIFESGFAVLFIRSEPELQGTRRTFDFRIDRSLPEYFERAPEDPGNSATISI